MINFEIDSETKTLIGGFILLLILLFGVQSCVKHDFKEICDKSNGTTIFDGRQYQCLPATIKSK